LFITKTPTHYWFCSLDLRPLDQPAVKWVSNLFTKLKAKADGPLKRSKAAEQKNEDILTHHHQPNYVPTAGAQAFLMDYT
jgi:hypothetical protein